MISKRRGFRFRFVAIVLSAVVLSVSFAAADVIKIELKNGKTLEIPTEDISQMYFEKREHGRFPFKVTEHKYSESQNNSYACKSEFGDAYQLASWQDVVEHSKSSGSLDIFLKRVGMKRVYGEEGSLTLHLSNKGREIYSGDRHYFISRHDGRIPGNYLAHETFEDRKIALGSWRGSRPALCIAK